MQKLLEDYLTQVASHLQPLPEARRREELREMRQHLQNAVIVNQEMGQSEDEAATNALEQFGGPTELGENVVWAWRREERKQDRGRLWRMGGITAAFCLFVGFHSPHDLGRLFFALPYILLVFGCRKWVSKPASRALRVWACAGAVLLLLHPFSVTHLLWTHAFTQALNFCLVGAFFFLRFREQRRREEAATSR